MWVVAHLVYGNGNILEHRVLREISSSVHRAGQQTDESSTSLSEGSDEARCFVLKVLSGSMTVLHPRH